MARGRFLKIRRRAVVSGVAFSAAFSTLMVFAYNPFLDRVNGAPVPPRWNNATITWALNPTVGSNVDSTSGTSPVPVETAVVNAFDVWPQTPLGGQTINALNLVRGANSTLTDPDSKDCLNLISFVPSSSVTFSTGVIAFAQIATETAGSGASPPFTYRCGANTFTSDLPAVLIDADMVFNPTEQFSTSSPPLANRFDVQSIASHEFGHMLGLDHSGIGHTMLFPFGNTRATGQPRNLAVDDVLGLAFLYPASNFNNLTGIISGQITLNNSGIFASHVVAVDRNTGAAVVDGLTKPDGTYRLVGVPPGAYDVLVLPLSGVYTLDNFSGWSCGFDQTSPPCCDPATEPTTCTGSALSPPTNYTGKFF